MKNNELSALEKLDIAIQSHRFYNEQCQNLEKQINKRIDVIFQTEEAGVEPTKEDIKDTVKLVDKLLTLSSRYLKEGQNVLETINGLGKEDIEKEAMQVMRKQLTSLYAKQTIIHNRVGEIQEMLVEMYNIDEDTF